MTGINVLAAIAIMSMVWIMVGGNFKDEVVPCWIGAGLLCLLIYIIHTILPNLQI